MYQLTCQNSIVEKKKNHFYFYNTFTKLYSSYICPILDYSAGVWGYKQFYAPDVVQNRSLRYFLGVHRFASNSAINGDMGWLSCRNRRKIAMINLWNRLVKIPTNRFIHLIFKWDRIFSNRKKYMVKRNEKYI